MIAIALLSSSLFLAAPEDAKRYFTITVVDEQTGRGVPLVELRTVNDLRYFTDSNGVVAFREPGLMDLDVFFHVTSHGYEYPKDGFGSRGKTLRTTPGGSAKLTMGRLNIAERLYRVTGGGIYSDSMLVGATVPLKEPLLNGQVLGSDTVLNAIYRGKVYWYWGDTNRPSYPIGNYQVPGATSELPDKGGLDPERGVDLTYFINPKGFAKETMKMPGKGPTWLTALVPLKDKDGKEKLFGSFVKIEPPLKVYGRGLAVWNDEKEVFDKLSDIDMKAPIFPQGHAFRHVENCIDYVYFADPYPLTRVRATAEDFQQIEAFESFTCLKEDGQLDRDDVGTLHYRWKKNTPAVKSPEQAKLKLKTDEALVRLRDRDTAKAIFAHAGSVSWNAHRQRWVMITVQAGGTSYLGEVWYAEADSPTGPWLYAIKVATHEKYSFYNPKQNPMFDKDGGKIIFFEGTYTHTFSGNPDPTPRYDYNQVMYKLDLSDKRLSLPVPMYASAEKGFVALRQREKEEPIAFFALDHPGVRSVPIVFADGTLRIGKSDEKSAFHAVRADIKNPPATTLPLFEYRKDAERYYTIDPELKREGWQRAEAPLCLVWSK